jgi:hypothetical protein
MDLNPELKDIDFEERPQFDEAGIQELMPPGSEPDGLGVRAKTPLRFKYEAQVEVLKKEIGDLEEIRRRLGMTRRQMAQLLLVDPSAWTRWVQTGAPPHIYQALAWYLRLGEAERVSAGSPIRELSSDRSAFDVSVSEPLAAVVNRSLQMTRETASQLESKLQSAIDSKLDRETGFLYQIQRELQSYSSSFDTGWMQTRRWLLVFAASQILFLIFAIAVLNR